MRLPTVRLVLASIALVGLLAAGCATTQRPVTEPQVPERVDAGLEAAPPAEPSPASPADGWADETLPPEVFAAAGDDTDLDESFSTSPLDELADVQPEYGPEAPEGLPEPAASEPLFDVPIEITDEVRYWLDYYSNAHHDKFRVGLVRSGRYVPMFRRIFAEEGLPQDLVYMAHVESAYKTSAYSRARALGIWQFISSTARTYGLKIDYWVDERRDPEKAARAAAAYLKKLYGDFGDWYLALAAYNGGEGRVSRALDRSGRDDFWGLADTRYLRRETRNYVPAILAAILISKEPEKYGFSFEPEPELAYETITVEGAADLQVLADCAGTDFDTLHELNPMLRRNQTPPHASTEVRLPPGSGERTLAALQQVPTEERVLYVRHRVRGGDTLSDLARKYGVSVSAIQQANQMGRRTMIRVGDELTIPTVAAGRYAGASTVAAASSSTSSSGPAGEVISYRVRRGDNLWSISRRYDTTPAAIAAASGISERKLLQVGERLTVVTGTRSADQARRIAGGETTVAARAEGGARTHVVRRGDTLWRIATQYSTTVEQICALNGISRQTTLYPGTRLAVSP